MLTSEIYDVFISYRRKGGSEKAQLVKSELEKRGVEDKRIFLDTHSLHDGDFEQNIKVAISQSRSVLVIISQGCFDEVKETDYWYIEIQEALTQGKKVIPFFFDGITSFGGLNVPDELAALTKMNAVTYQHEYADMAFDRLLSFLDIQPVSQRSKKRGCLFSFKYKGCLVSVTLIGLLLFYFFVPNPSFENSRNPSSSLTVELETSENQETPPLLADLEPEGNSKEPTQEDEETSQPPRSKGSSTSKRLQMAQRSEASRGAQASRERKTVLSLLGTWQCVDGKDLCRYEIMKDGKIFISSNNEKLECCDYSLKGDTLFIKGRKGNRTAIFKLSENRLSLTFDNGDSLFFKRLY